MSDVNDSDLATIARIVAEIDGLGVPSTAGEVADRLRRIDLARYKMEQRCTRLLADVDEVKQRLHDLRNTDAHKLAAADLAALRMASELRAAVAAADAVDTD